MSEDNKEETKNEEEPPQGAMAKAMHYWRLISHSLPYHIIQSLLSYLALITMIVALTVLAFPPHFNPEVLKAGKGLSVPAATRIFNLVHAARLKPELQNGTTYRFASQNGKYGIRVCTDLTEKEFEAATGLVEADRKWDNMNSNDIKKFIDDGCANTTILAFNSNCNMRTNGELKGGAYYSVKQTTGAFPVPAAVPGGKPLEGRGRCGKPAWLGGKGNLLFTQPDPGHGWLWTMMIRKPTHIKLGGFPADRNLTHSNCTQAICNKPDALSKNACDSNKGRLCYDDSEKKCLSKVELQKTGGVCMGPKRTNCTCNTHYEFIPGEPEWIINNKAKYENTKCRYAFGPLDADMRVWKKKRADTASPCLKKHVLGYGYENKAIVGLFIAGAILRIGNQILSLYWGCTEDDPDYRVLFTTETFFRIVSICTKGLDFVNEVIDTKWQTGWPWLIGYFDSAFVALATLGCAIGADPFPDLIKGRLTMFFLWLSAIRECLKLLYKTYSAYSKKPWIIQEASENVECCGKTIPWCGPVKKPEDAYKDEQTEPVNPNQIEMGVEK